MTKPATPGKSARQREGPRENRAGVDPEHLRGERDRRHRRASVRPNSAPRHQRDQRGAGEERERRGQQRVRAPS